MSVTPAKKRSEYSASDTIIFTYAYDGSRLSKTVGLTKKNPVTTTEYILNGSTILAQNTTYPDGSKETLNFYYSSDGKLLEIGYLNNTSNDDTKTEDIKETHYMNLCPPSQMDTILRRFQLCVAASFKDK